MDHTDEQWRTEICARPDDDGLRLQYADWLDGDKPDASEFDTLRAAFVRWQITGQTDEKDWAGIPYDLGWFCDKRHLWGHDKLSKVVYAMAGSPKAGDPGFGSYSWNARKDRSVYCETGPDGAKVTFTYRRGFLDELRCPAAAWLAHGNDLAWSPAATERCPKCAGTGMVRDAGIYVSLHDKVECGTCGGRKTIPRRCPECHGKGYCPRCSGEGCSGHAVAANGPCLGSVCSACGGTKTWRRPATAQPVTKVVLTDAGSVEYDRQYWPNWPKMVDLARKHGESFELTMDGEESARREWEFVLRTFAAEWPWVAFGRRG